MTTGPRLRLGRTLVPGVLAVALFAVMGLIALNSPFEAMPSEPFAGVSVTANIGYAMLDLTALQEVPSEPFLASFILAAIVLDAALDASLVLAKREEQGEPVAALSTTGEVSSSGEGAEPAVADGGQQSPDAGGENR